MLNLHGGSRLRGTKPIGDFEVEMFGRERKCLPFRFIDVCACRSRQYGGRL
jgi:hypothetical protein